MAKQDARQATLQAVRIPRASTALDACGPYPHPDPRRVWLRAHAGEDVTVEQDFGLAVRVRAADESVMRICWSETERV